MSIESFIRGLTGPQVARYFNALEKFIADSKLALKDKGVDFDADVAVAIDVAGALSGLPVIGEYAGDVEKGLVVVKFIHDHGVPHNSGEGGIGRKPEGEGFDVGGI